MKTNTTQKSNATMSTDEIKKNIGQHLTAIKTLVEQSNDDKLTYAAKYQGTLTGFSTFILGKEKKVTAPKAADKPAVVSAK